VLAFFGNLAPSEVLVLAVIAVLVFGRRLPEVAGQGYKQLRRWRQSLDQLRRETGIDREIRNIEHEVRDASRKAQVDDDLARVNKAEQSNAVEHTDEPAQPLEDQDVIAEVNEEDTSEKADAGERTP